MRIPPLQIKGVWHTPLYRALCL